MRATRRAARDDPDPQIHAKETILHLLRLLFLNITSPTPQLSRSASLTAERAHVHRSGFCLRGTGRESPGPWEVGPLKGGLRQLATGPFEKQGAHRASPRKVAAP